MRALGQMDTTSRTATGKLAEMKKTFTELSVVYKNMSDQEKASPVGQALAQSLDQLKSRIGESKSQLSEINNTMNDTGGIMGMLKDKFTVNIDAVKLFSLGLQAAEGALNVAKDAFFNNEQQLDEWGRVVESSESLYKGFLNALNTGDISGYLSNISNIVQAARDAYDALDELNTYNAFNQINVEKTRTNMTESIVDFREGIGSKDAVREAGEAYKKELRDRQKKEEEAFKKRVGELAATRGVDAEGLESVLRGTYDDYKKKKGIQPTGERQTVIGAGAFARLGTENFAQNKLEKMAEALRNLNDTELQSVQSLGAQAERTGNEITQVDRQLIRVLNGRQPGAGGGRSGGGRSGGGSDDSSLAPDSIAAQQKRVQELTKKWQEASAELRNGYKKELDDAKRILADMQNPSQPIKKLYSEDYSKANMGEITGGIPGIGKGLDKLPEHLSPLQQMNKELARMKELLELSPDSTAYQAALEQIANKQKEIDEFTGVGNKTAKSWSEAARAINMVGSAIGGLQDPAAQIASTVAMAIANIAMAYSETLAKDASSKSNIWYFIATTAAAMVSMATTISSIHSATGYAEGGEIKGNQYSGDNIPIMANAGEVVLTKAMQGSLAQQLESPRGGGGFTASHVSGEQIWIALNAYTKRSGQGEIVTWR